MVIATNIGIFKGVRYVSIITIERLRILNKDCFERFKVI